MAVDQAIVKILALAFGTACYVLLVFFHHDLYTTYEKLIVCAVFAGFLVLYIAFAIGVFLGRETDADLNSAWALYGVAAYCGAGLLCITSFANRTGSTAVMGIVGGCLAFVQAGILVGDIVILQLGE